MQLREIVKNPEFHFIFACTDLRREPECQCMDHTSSGSCVSCKASPLLKSNYVSNFFNTKFGLVIRGDTPSTSRLYDTICSGAMPIILSEHIKYIGLPFVEVINYEDFSFFINREKTEVLSELVKIISQTPESVLKLKYEALLKVQEKLCWRMNHSTVFDHILQQAYFDRLDRKCWW